jgi:hypothetical protein
MPPERLELVRYGINGSDDVLLHEMFSSLPEGFFNQAFLKPTVDKSVRNNQRAHGHE